jgi:putative flippase GtrA
VNFRPTLRYVVSSGATWFVDFVAFIVLYRFVGIPIGLLISRCLAGCVGFVFHKWFSFRSRSRIIPREVIGYCSLALVNYLLSVSLISILPHDSDGRVAAAKIGVEIAIFVANYLFLRALFLREPLPKAP